MECTGEGDGAGLNWNGMGWRAMGKIKKMAGAALIRGPHSSEDRIIPGKS